MNELKNRRKIMRRMGKGLALSIVASTVVMAGGYKIPEQSLNAVALSAAYVAHTSGADTAYFNPANMAFMADKKYVDGAITLAHLPSNTYTLAGPVSGESEEENIVIPNFHYVSNAMGNFRWGVSLTAPGGLTKRWKTPFQKASAEEFTLKIVELSPSFSYKLAENFSVGGGIRIIYSEGIVKSNSADASAINPLVPSASRDLEGDTIEFGYNLALAYKPTSDINVAVTYRSKVDLNEEGEATIAAAPFGTLYKGPASVEVPLPAALNLAISKTWENKYTLEFNYERTYWSSYETLDFEYTGAGSAFVPPAFDNPINKGWEDTNTFRLGATAVLDDKFTLMAGFAIDETPAPTETLGFELPDSDSKVYSMGFRYQQSNSISWGVAFVYSDKEELTLQRGAHEDPRSVLNNGGTFSDGGAFLTTVGMAYEF